MMPVSTPTIPIPAPASRGLRLAAEHAREAARQLLAANHRGPDSARLREIAERLDRALASPRGDRARLLAASPFVFERSGRAKTLIEMIADEPEGGVEPIRLAKLLIRALSWQPDPQGRPAG